MADAARPRSASPDEAARSDSIWAPIPIYPPLVAVVLVLTPFLAADASISAAVRPLALVFAGSIVLTGMAALALKDLRRGALAATGLIVVLRTADVLHAGLAVLLIAVVVLAMAFLARARRVPVVAAATPLLNAVALALLAVVCAQAVLIGAPFRIAREMQPFSAQSAAAGDGDRPDIFVLFLEDYPRADTLQRLFGFDNAGFLRRLTSEGLSVATSSRANYMYTALNMTALLQMRYIADLREVEARRNGHAPEPSLYELINVNPVFDQLRARGYEIFSSVGRWEEESIRRAEGFCGGEQINEFEFQLLKDSLLSPALDVLTPGWQGARDRSVINAELDCARNQINGAGQESRPRLVFAHIEGPHTPIVFDRDGDPAPASVYFRDQTWIRSSPDEFHRAYTEEVQYLNSQVLALIDQIRRTARTPPIILVMSDEGSESFLDYSNWANSDLRERFGILFAASTPGHPALFGDDPMTVNVFATLLNAYFGTALPIRPDRFFASNAGDPLQTTEVADPFPSP